MGGDPGIFLKPKRRGDLFQIAALDTSSNAAKQEKNMLFIYLPMGCCIPAVKEHAHG
jgi:hypothetical protein